MSAASPTWVAGVDGCPAGWVAVFRDVSGGNPPRLRTFATFGLLLDAPEAPERIAVDMPIGLPERIHGAGRAAEQAVRRCMDRRKSSVFSVPARDAVYCGEHKAQGQQAIRARHRKVSKLARTLSEPPRGVSIQTLMILPKIVEIDRLMTPSFAERVFETHPEVAFWLLNGKAAMNHSKKQKPGLEERRDLLARHGFARSFLEQKPTGVGRDDVIDAAVNALVAERHLAGKAKSFPDQPQNDERGLPVAIWA